jgi:hypothetical protein
MQSRRDSARASVPQAGTVHHDVLKGWYGVMEELCAPVDEVENFNRRVRDPAAEIVR